MDFDCWQLLDNAYNATLLNSEARDGWCLINSEGNEVIIGICRPGMWY